MSKSFCLALLLLVALPLGAGEPAAGYETLLTQRIDGEVVIDQEGNVVSHRIAGDIAPGILGLLDKAIAQWKFHPYLSNGVAVRARSKMRITVAARQAGADYEVSIDNVVFHDGRSGATEKRGSDAPDPSGIDVSVARRTARIKYPAYNVNGMTVVAVRISPEGQVDDILATQTIFLNAEGHPDEFERARKEMEDNAISAIRRWKFKVVIPPGVEPQPEQLTGTLMINYVMMGRGEKLAKQTGRWRHETRTLNRAIPWIRDTRVAQEVHASDLDEALQMLPNASGFRLREGAGKAL